MTSTSFAAEALPGTGSASPLGQTLELVHLSPAMLGLAVGALTGVVIFLVVTVLLVRRGARRARRVQAANAMVLIPPYPTMASSYPPPPSSAFPQPVTYAPAAPELSPPSSLRASPSSLQAALGPGFTPSSALSARAFARMGFAFGERIVDEPPVPSEISGASELPSSDLVEDEVSETGQMTPVQMAPEPAAVEMNPVQVSPVVVLGPPPPARATDTAPHPLAVIASGSPALSSSATPAPPKAAPIDELSFDDSPTEFCEPFFDEPPQPLRRGSRPKIRKVAPAPPRFVQS